MKTRNLFYVLSLAILSGCSGSYAPPFEYIENSRIIVEGYVANQNGTPIANHKVDLMSSQMTDIGSTFTDASGRFFLSTPRGNYAYSLEVGTFSILSADRYTNLLKSNPQDLPNYFPKFGSLTGLYYNFGTIKINKP